MKGGVSVVGKQTNNSKAPEFTKWSGVLWRLVLNSFVAYCPEHKHRLDIHDKYGRNLPQDTQGVIIPPVSLICPVDDTQFDINGGSFSTMKRRYSAMLESASLRGATYRDMDNIYTPVLKVSPKPKDDRYSIQVEVDNTPGGKKMVIYAMDRQNPEAKTQVFIDPQSDKISFDSNDLHPNMIFSKVVAHFKDGKSATMEQQI